MKALVFGAFPDPPPPAPPADAPRLVRHLAATPMDLREVPDPEVRGPAWAVLRPRLTGICGSDTKQVLMDFEGADDSPMTAFISFPQVLGHEVVATVEDAGPDAGVTAGQRVVLNPWLSCEVRGIEPMCPACAAGDLSLCWRFLDGDLAPGIHTGNSVDATGGFAELLPAHRRMMLPVPDEVPDEVAVLADPFAVALHAVTRTPPPPGSRVVVYGAGALGTCTTAILRSLHPSVEVATVAMWDAQEALSADLGATTFAPHPRVALIEAITRWSGGILRQPWERGDGAETLPIAWPGGVEVVYDTVGSPETIEVGLRVLAGRGSIVQMGVSSPARCEWTPWYFKEARLIGSNAFGVEEVDGVRQHAIAHYLDLVVAGRIDLTGLLTHTFALADWRLAFETLINQGETGAVKCAFDFR
jgi:threonine dehydrogenase-like Zn-dependent dehydrogenase